MRLTKNFSLDELTASGTAARLGIDNTPNDLQLQNLRRLAELLQQVRDHFNVPVFINSGFRNKALNDAVGSNSKKSQHLLGCAADIRISGVSPKEGVQRIIDAKIISKKKNPQKSSIFSPYATKLRVAPSLFKYSPHFSKASKRSSLNGVTK